MSTWLPVRLQFRSAIRLYSFPYAGGNSTIFRDWQRYFPSAIEICPVELPGRGQRLKEPLLRDLEKLARLTAEGLKPLLRPPFALFGHSMGALVAFEVARIFAHEDISPEMLFVAGARAPHFRENVRHTYDLPEAEFLEELRTINGTPAKLLNNAEMMDLLLPIIRADFQAVQTYRHMPGPPLTCPIVAFGGLVDSKIQADQLCGWRDYTVGEFSHGMLNGDHFFIYSALQDLTKRITKLLLNNRQRHLTSSTL